MGSEPPPSGPKRGKQAALMQAMASGMKNALSKIRVIQTEEEYNAAREQLTKEMYVLFLYQRATCPPELEAQIEALARKYDKLTILKVDVDVPALKDLVGAFQTNTLPSYRLVIKGNLDGVFNDVGELNTRVRFFLNP